MPFDNEGMFSRLHNWEDDRINDIDIVTDHMDEEDDNFAEGLSQCLLRNGKSKMEGDFNVGNFKITNVADGVLADDAVNLSQLEKSTENSATIIKELMNAMINVGDIKASTISENHANWLLCDGQEVSREDYADLFALIGDKFGEGNGVTTFNVPDYRSKFLRGLGDNSAEDIYTAQEESLPNITGNINLLLQRHGTHSADGAFNLTTSNSNGGDYTSVGAQARFSFDASKSNKIYGASEHVTPENYAVYWFIKAKKEE